MSSTRFPSPQSYYAEKVTSQGEINMKIIFSQQINYLFVNNPSDKEGNKDSRTRHMERKARQRAEAVREVTRNR